ncbi:hypothetical protein [Sphingomonas sp. 1185]|uniref:hypothetical protein n=1 Tax=Sphingomonas sp. 1185 TaxID=3156411 RepID=UPI0033985F7F
MRFVVAIKRGLRGQGIEATNAGQVPGVTLVGASNPDRIVVDASDEAVAEVRRRFGSFMHVEPLIGHSTL